jgi:hypothetical protein
MTLKLLKSSLASAQRRAQLESTAQQGSAAKAVLSLEHSCPTVSMAPVLAIV